LIPLILYVQTYTDHSAVSTSFQTPQKGIDIDTYSNKGKINGPKVEVPKSTGGGIVLYPQTKGLFTKTATLASKLLIGPKSLEQAFRTGLGKPLFGPYWCVHLLGIRVGCSRAAGQ